MRIYNLSNKSYVAVIIGCLIVITACTSQTDSNVATGIQTQTLHLGNGTEPQDLDPHVVTGVTEHNIITALMEGLVAKHPIELTPEPAVAHAWDISEDGRQYIFHLRNNARWSNGDRVTAHDFVYAWRRGLTSSLGNQYAYMLYPVVNAERYNKGELDDFSQVGVRALDDFTLEVLLTHSTPYFLGLLDHYSAFPLHQATIEKHGDMDSRGSQWTRAGNFVGNGPFILKVWEQNRIIEVEKNPYYWDADTVRLNAIHFHPIQQINTEERMFRTGQLHITYTMAEEKIAGYLQDNPELIHMHPYFGTYYYTLNTTVPPLDNPRVRMALAMSIDRKAIVENVTKGGQLPAHTFTPPDTLGYTSNASVPYDVEQARQLLAEAGYPDGQGFPEIRLLFNTLETHHKIAVAIQQMWKQALNINISLYNQDWKVYLDSMRTMNYQMARAAWIGDYIDPNTFLDMFVTDGGNNRTGWSNAEYDDLIARAAGETDQQQRFALFQRAEAILMDEVPIIPIYTYARIFLKSPDVKGWYPNIMDYHPYKYVYLEASTPN
jgi:oligopeptide transport system substrate-binding protein